MSEASVTKSVSKPKKSEKNPTNKPSRMPALVTAAILTGATRELTKNVMWNPLSWLMSVSVGFLAYNMLKPSER